MSDAHVEYLAHHDTEIGTLILCRREIPSQPGHTVTEIMLDHAFLMSSHVTHSERALARIALEMHAGSSLQALVGGLGLGYTAAEALASTRVARTEIVELSPGVIAWMRQGLVPLSSRLTADPRVRILEGDVFARLARAPDPAGPRFDLILIDVDHAPDEPLLGEPSRAFYGVDGLRAAQRHLAPGGVLGVWSYAESAAFAGALRTAFGEVRIVPVTFVNELIDAETTNWLFFARGPAL